MIEYGTDMMVLEVVVVVGEGLVLGCDARTSPSHFTPLLKGRKL